MGQKIWYKIIGILITSCIVTSATNIHAQGVEDSFNLPEKTRLDTTISMKNTTENSQILKVVKESIKSGASTVIQDIRVAKDNVIATIPEEKRAAIKATKDEYSTIIKEEKTLLKQDISSAVNNVKEEFKKERDAFRARRVDKQETEE